MNLTKITKFELGGLNFLMAIFNVIMSFFILKLEFAMGAVIGIFGVLYLQEKILLPSLKKAGGRK